MMFVYFSSLQLKLTIIRSGNLVSLRSPASYYNAWRINKNRKNTILSKTYKVYKFEEANLTTIKSSQASDQGLKAEKTTTELWPPNPKEFEIAARSRSEI